MIADNCKISSYKSIARANLGIQCLLRENFAFHSLLCHATPLPYYGLMHFLLKFLKIKDRRHSFIYLYFYDFLSFCHVEKKRAEIFLGWVWRRVPVPSPRADPPMDIGQSTKIQHNVFINY